MLYIFSDLILNSVNIFSKSSNQRCNHSGEVALILAASIEYGWILPNSGCHCRKRGIHSLPILSYTFTWTSSLSDLTRRSLMISTNRRSVSYRGEYPEIVRRVAHRINSFSLSFVRFWFHELDFVVSSPLTRSCKV